MSLKRPGQISDTAKLGLIGVALVVVGVFAPREGSSTGESLWTVARDSTWKKIGDWPAAAASLQIMLVSCGLILLVLAGRSLWHNWLMPRFLHRVLFLISLVPIVSLLVGLYYLFKAVF